MHVCMHVLLREVFPPLGPCLTAAAAHVGRIKQALQKRLGTRCIGIKRIIPYPPLVALPLGCKHARNVYVGLCKIFLFLARNLIQDINKMEKHTCDRPHCVSRALHLCDRLIPHATHTHEGGATPF